MSELQIVIDALSIPGLKVGDAGVTDAVVPATIKEMSIEFRHAGGSFVSLHKGGRRIELFDTDPGSRITALPKDSVLNALGIKQEDAKPEKEVVEQQKPAPETPKQDRRSRNEKRGDS